MPRFMLLALMGGVLPCTLATPINEIEPNDTFATAHVLPVDFFDPYGAGAVEGVLGDFDVDFFRVALPADVLVTASIFDFTPADPFDNDSLLGIFRPDGTLFAADDDSGPGYLSAYAFFPDTGGQWGFAVTGGGDDAFTGQHDENYTYRLVLSIPEPVTAFLLLVALLVRRR